MASIHRRTNPVRGDVSYVVRYRDEYGNSRSKSFAEHVKAVRFSNKIEVQLAEGDWLDPKRGRMTFGDFHAQWLAARKVSPSREHTEASQAKVHIYPKWKDVRLDRISELEIKAWIRDLKSQIRTTGRPNAPARAEYRDASPTTKEMVLLQFKMCLDAAVKDNRIRTNPAADVKAPSRERKPLTQNDVLNEVEVDKLATAIPGEWKALVFLASWLGLRWSESLGLRWRDVDLDHGLLHVANETIVESKGRTKVNRGGKTAAATRVVHLPAFAVDLLREHRERPWREPGSKFYKAPAPSEDDRVFLTEPCPAPGRHASGSRKGGCTAEGICKGHIPLRSNFRRVFVKAVKDADLEGRGINVRQLRHTAASLMLSNGVGVLEVAATLGHAKASTTLNIYSRILAGRREASTELLNSAMSMSAVSFAKAASTERAAS